MRPVLALILLSLTLVGRAQEPYPSHPVRMITPYPPGGSSDNVSRVIAERLSTQLGHPMELFYPQIGRLATIVASADKEEGVNAFKEKRKPRFSGR